MQCKYMITTFDDSNTQKEKYYAVTGGANCLGEVLDGGVRLLGDVFECVVSLDNTTADQADDARPMKQLCCDIGHVGSTEQGKRLCGTSK